jgi:hypothetical protein
MIVLAGRSGKSRTAQLRVPKDLRYEHRHELERLQSLSGGFFSELSRVESELFELLCVLLVVDLGWQLREDFLCLCRASLLLEFFFDEVSWDLHERRCPPIVAVKNFPRRLRRTAATHVHVEVYATARVRA